MVFFRCLKFVLLIAATAACSQMCSKNHRDMGPEDVVEAYLGIALNMDSPEQREDLMAYTTGTLNESLGQADEETIMKAYVQRSYHVISYSVVERIDRTPREAEITFRLVYEDRKPGSTDKEYPEVTTENKLSLIRQDGRWFIRDILGNKTSLAFPLMPESYIKPE